MSIMRNIASDIENAIADGVWEDSPMVEAAMVRRLHELEDMYDFEDDCLD